MCKFYLFLFLSLFLSNEISAQFVEYVLKKQNAEYFHSETIRFYDSGRFELIQDHTCYDIIMGVGVFDDTDADSIKLKFFELTESRSEIAIQGSYFVKLDIEVSVYSLKDSSIINSAKVFASDNSYYKKQEKNKAFYLDEKVDSTGKLTFSVPEGKKITQISASANMYKYCTLRFEEKYNGKCFVKFYLSEDWMEKKDYEVKVVKEETMHRKGNDEILYKGNIYTRK